MATVKSSSLTCLIHHLLRYRKSIHHDERHFPYIFSSLPLPRPFMPLVPKSFSSVDDSVEDKDNISLASLRDNNDEEEEDSMRESGRNCETSEEVITQISASKLSAKEKKTIASYANSLGDELKCQLVGKSGITDSVVFSFIETLEKNELVKVKIHRTCPGELEDTILNLKEATGSVSVGQIGRTVILYRPSLHQTESRGEEKEGTRVCCNLYCIKQGIESSGSRVFICPRLLHFSNHVHFSCFSRIQFQREFH